MLRFKLAEVMARYHIKNKDLAEAIGVSSAAISGLKHSDSLPEIGGERLCLIAQKLTVLIGKELNPLDLIEYIPN